MKRRISLFIMGVMTVSLILSGCKKADENESKVSDETTEEIQEIPSGDVSLTVWGAEEDAELLAQIVESFKAEYGSQANFTITIGACAESDSRDTIINDLDNAADVFTFADDQLAILAAAGILQPIEYNLDDVKNRNNAASVAASSVNDTVYAYPLTADNGYFLYYDKRYFSEDDLTTLDKVLSVCSSNGKKMTMDCGSGWYLYSFYGNTGLELGVNADGISNFCTWNSTEGDITGVDVAQAIMAIGRNSGFLKGGDGELNAGSASGSVIAGVSGVWNTNSLAEAWGTENLGAVKLPTYTVAGQQVQMASYTGFKMVGVNAYSENHYWAEVLADWITNEKNQTLRFTTRGQGPSNTSAASSSEVAASPAIQAVIAQSEFGQLQRVGSNYWGPAGDLGNAMISGSTGGLELQEFLDNIVAGITASNAK